MIAPLAGVTMMARPLLGQAVSLKMVESRSMVNPVAGSRPSGPGPCQQLAAYPVQLTYVAPAEAAQEGTQCGRRFTLTVQHPTGAAGPQCVGVAMQSPPARAEAIRVISLSPAFARPGASPRQVMVNQLTQPRFRARVAGRISPALLTRRWSGDLDAVGVLKW